MKRKNMLAKHNQRLVWSVVRKFGWYGYELDDLFQIGMTGLIKSIERFIFSYVVKFSRYAVLMISDELRYYLEHEHPIYQSFFNGYSEQGYKEKLKTSLFW